MVTPDSSHYNLWYARSKDSTSSKDLDKQDEHLVSLNGDGTLNHLCESEKEKICFWKLAQWEKGFLTKDTNEPVTRSEVDALRGNYLELQALFLREKRKREELSNSEQKLQERSNSSTMDLTR